MNEFFKKLKQESLNIKLSQNEKQHMRAALYDAMKSARLSPGPAVSEMKYTRVRSTYVWFSPRFALPVAVILILGMGSGTAFAAQGALPGDVLYTIKVSVTEPALGALAISDEAKAQWNAQVAQTRLEEAESLAAQGRLDDSNSAALEQDFDDHSNKAQELAQKVDEEEPGTGAEIAAQFGSSLEAHNAILTKLGASKVAAHAREHGAVTLALATRDMDADDGAAGQDSMDNASFKTMSIQVSTFAATMPQDIATATASSSTDTDATATMEAKKQMPPQNTAPVKISSKLKKSAASALNDAQKAFASVKGALDASTTAQVQDKLARIDAAIDAASSTASLTGALKDATVLKAFLKASKKLNRNLFESSNRPSSGSTADNGDDRGDHSVATTTASTTTEASTTVQLNAGKGSEDESHDNNDDKGGKGDSNDEGLVHRLLNNL